MSRTDLDIFGGNDVMKSKKKNKNQPHVKLQPIGEWGTVIPFVDLKTDLKRTFEKIIEKYWNHLGGAY